MGVDTESAAVAHSSTKASVLLQHLVELSDCVARLPNTRGLLCRRAGDFAGQLDDPLHLLDDLSHEYASLVDLPMSPFSTLAPISHSISLAAPAERPSGLRTSQATTAEPHRCSPACAPSNAAFSARMSVWKATP
jgi:hypothetical protein